MKMKLIGGGIDETVYTALQHAYSFWAHIDFGVEWIRNPGLLFRYPYQMYESERHKHWIHFLQDNHIRIMAHFLLKNEFSLDKWHEMKSIEGIGFDILMKAIDCGLTHIVLYLDGFDSFSYLKPQANPPTPSAFCWALRT